MTAHKHVREQAGLFDVSHMVQQTFRGAGALAFLSWLCPSSLAGLAPHSSTLSVLLNADGGIIDDMMVTKHDDEAWYVVTNAGRANEDAKWIGERLAEWRKAGDKGEVEWEILKGYGLVALQGAAVARGRAPLRRTKASPR